MNAKKCPKCVEEGERSTLRNLGGYVTAMYCPPFYDEDGVYHRHDSNIHTSEYRCSRGHRFTTSGYASCPVLGCSFGSEPPVVEISE